MRKTITTIALSLIALTASAHEVDVKEALSLPIAQIKQVYSLPGEGRSAFVERIAPEFAAYTEQTGHEACGVIAVLANGADGVNPTFSVSIGTIGSQIGCANGLVANGYISMGTTIHSHPQARTIRLTAIDMKVRGTPAGKLRTESPDKCKFSEQDYKGDGFLVTCGKLMYQSGKGTERVVAQLTAPANTVAAK